MLRTNKQRNASPMSATITPPTPPTIEAPSSDSWMFLDLKTAAITRPQTKKIPKKIASPLTPSLNQLILDQVKLSFRFFGSSTLNSRVQWGHDTKSPIASTSSFDLQRGQRICTTRGSNLVQVHARDFFTGVNAALNARWRLTLSKEIHWNEKVLLTAPGMPVSKSYERDEMDWIRTNFHGHDEAGK